MTRGLVGENAFGVLPDIRPAVTFVLTLISQLPSLYVLWRRPTKQAFYESLILCGYGSFLFGWHVHEKAALLMIVPMSLIVLSSASYFKPFMLLQIAGHFALFPLLFRPEESLIKIVVWLAYSFLFVESLAAAMNGSLMYVSSLISLILRM